MRGVVFAALAAVGVASMCSNLDVSTPVPVLLGTTVELFTNLTAEECCSKCNDETTDCDVWQWFDNNGDDVDNCQLLTEYAGQGVADQSFWFGDFSNVFVTGAPTSAPSKSPSAVPSSSPTSSPSSLTSLSPTMNQKKCTTIDQCLGCDDCIVGELWGGRITTDELTSDLLSKMTSVVKLDFHSSNLKGLPEHFLDAQANLEDLDLEDNIIKSLPQGIFDKCGKLTVLHMAYNKLTDLKADVFKMNTELKALYLDHNDLSSLPEGIFDTLTKLETLSLNANKLTKLPKGLFDGAKSLQTVYLQDNLLTNFESRAFVPNVALKQLVFRNNPMTVLTPGLLSSLPGVDIYAPPEVLCTEIGEKYNREFHSLCVKHNTTLGNLCLEDESWVSGSSCVTVDPDSAFEYLGVQYGCPFPAYTGSVSPSDSDPYFTSDCALATNVPTGAPSERPTPAPTLSPVANTTAKPRKSAASSASSFMAAFVFVVVFACFF